MFHVSFEVHTLSISFLSPLNHVISIAIQKNKLTFQKYGPGSV